MNPGSVVRWAYDEPHADDALAFRRSETTLPGGSVLAVEHMTFDTVPVPAERVLAAEEGSTTEGCEIGAALLLDSMFGTVLHVAGTQWDWSGTAACTR